MSEAEQDTSEDFHGEELAHFGMGGVEGSIIDDYRLRLRGRRRSNDYLGDQHDKLAVDVMVESEKDGQQGEWMPLNEALDNYEEVDFL